MLPDVGFMTLEQSIIQTANCGEDEIVPCALLHRRPVNFQDELGFINVKL